MFMSANQAFALIPAGRLHQKAEVGAKHSHAWPRGDSRTFLRMLRPYRTMDKAVCRLDAIALLIPASLFPQLRKFWYNYWAP